MPREWGKLAGLLAVQFAVLVAIPLPTIRTRWSGTDVTLWTEAPDPFRMTARAEVPLAYEAERPGADASGKPSFAEGDELWVTVRRGEPAWLPVSVTAARPSEAPDRISMRARWHGSRAEIENGGGLRVEETEHEAVADALNAVGRHALVDLRVSPDGDVVVMRLRAGGQSFDEDE
jgi:GDYXXLXY motif protein